MTVNIPASGGRADAFVGDVVVKKSKSPKREPVTVSDPIARVLASEWSTRLGTLVSTFRQVRRGDWLNFEIEKPVNVLQIVERKMKKLEEYSFQTDQMVVDLMGGDKIEVGRVSPVEYKTPGEMLLIDDEGNVLVRNEFDQKRQFLLRSQGFDESSEYNANKRKSKAKKRGDEDDDDDGGIGGLGA